MLILIRCEGWHRLQRGEVWHTISSNSKSFIVIVISDMRPSTISKLLHIIIPRFKVINTLYIICTCSSVISKVLLLVLSKVLLLVTSIILLYVPSITWWLTVLVEKSFLSKLVVGRISNKLIAIFFCGLSCDNGHNIGQCFDSG